MLTQMLPTEGTDKIKFLQLGAVPIDESGPLVHFVPGLLVKLVLVIVILFLQLLRQFPNHIVFEFQQLPLLFVVVHQGPSLGKLSRQIVRQHINSYFKVLGHGVVDVLTQLTELVKELQLIRTLRIDLCHLRLFVLSDLFHGHQDLIDTCNVFLDLSDVMLQDRKFNTLG